jgi:hypothetical protein
LGKIEVILKEENTIVTKLKEPVFFRTTEYVISQITLTWAPSGSLYYGKEKQPHMQHEESE